MPDIKEQPKESAASDTDTDAADAASSVAVVDFELPPLAMWRVLGIALTAWGGVALAGAMLALTTDAAEPMVAGGAIGVGLGLIDAIVTSVFITRALTARGAPRKAMRFLFASFLVRLIVVVCGWVALGKVDLGADVFVFSFFVCHIVLIGTVAWTGNEWLGRVALARREAQEKAEASAKSADAGSANGEPAGTASE